MSNELPVANNQEINLAKNLNSLLAKHGLTLSAAATKVGMNKSTLHNYCNGVVPRNLVKIKELANLFDVSFSDLVFGAVAEKIQEASIEGRYEVTVRRINEPPRGQKR
jgi:transcriptional regulator with XRE-family HTH domain